MCIHSESKEEYVGLPILETIKYKCQKRTQKIILKNITLKSRMEEGKTYAIFNSNVYATKSLLLFVRKQKQIVYKKKITNYRHIAGFRHPINFS